jgi:nondiscriminating glutamyl-tRNA synthetase
MGNARTALFNWLFARKFDGTFVLRIEDTDMERSTLQSEEQIFEDLRWLGLDWDEGPGVEGDFGPYRQSERAQLYRDYARQLLTSGAAYRCFCTPEELEHKRQAQLKAGLMPRYDGTCKKLSAPEIEAQTARGLLYTLRFAIKEKLIQVDDAVRGRVTFEGANLGDFIILRSDQSAAYNFAVVVDDHLMRITHVIRGEDHLPNTPRQILIYRALGWETPVFAHLSMIMGPDHTKLSKRHGATFVHQYREKGYLPEALVNYLVLLGWSHPESKEIMPLEEIKENFTLERVAKSAAVFDIGKLNWMNGHYIRSYDPVKLTELARSYLEKTDFDLNSRESSWLIKVVEAVRGNLEYLSQIPEYAEVFFKLDWERASRREEVQAILKEESTLKVIGAWKEELAKVESLDASIYRQMAGQVKAITSCKGKSLFHPLRVALTGRASGPELEILLPILGKEECLRRLELALNSLKKK